MSEVAVVLIRGRIGIDKPVLDTLDQLGLKKKHHCAVHKDSALLRGKLQSVKDYCTWGEVSADTVGKLKAKSKGEKIVCALHPPRGGFERRGIKVPYTRKGALGNRKDKMNLLVEKML